MSNRSNKMSKEMAKKQKQQLAIPVVVDSMRISNDEITEQAYNSLNRTEHLTENHRQGYFHGYKNGCYWMRKKYSK